MSHDNISDEELMAYADGVLDAERAEIVRRRAAADPDIAERVALFRQSTDLLHGAFDPVLQEPVPDRLRDAASGVISLEAARAQRAAAPAPFSRSPLQRWPLALAAGLGVLALAVSLIVRRPADTVPDGLAVALAQLPAGEPASLAIDGQPGELLVLASFDDAGVLCREFAWRGDRSGSTPNTLACHRDGGWQFEASDAAPGDVKAPEGWATAGASDAVEVRTDTMRRLGGDEEADRLADLGS